MMKLTTSSYAVLGFIALQPTSAYDITRMMRESGTRYLWPRTESRIYKEFHNLVEHGLAVSKKHHYGQRERTIYTITEAGRRALKDWLDAPGAPVRTEDEALLKVFYANFGTIAQAHAQLRVVRDQIRLHYDMLIETLETLQSVGHPFPQRAHLSRLLVDQIRMSINARARWLENAETVLAGWSSTQVSGADETEQRAWLAETLAGLRKDARTFARSDPERATGSR